MRMPDILNEMTNPDLPPESDVRPASAQRQTSFSTGYSGDPGASKTGPVAETAAAQSCDPELPQFRITWEIKALLPIACVLLGGMLLFLLATLSWRDPERHTVLLVA